MKLKTSITFVSAFIVIVALLISGCSNNTTTDPYAGKRCIRCAKQATTSMQGTKSMCRSLNPNYNSANYKQGSTDTICTIYFCNDCVSSISSKEYHGLNK